MRPCGTHWCGGPSEAYGLGVGAYNFLVEGVSGTGKTSVCHELRRRGFHALNGDTDLAYQGDPFTGEPATGAPSHEQHLWRVDQVRSIAGDSTRRFTFFCGGSRNFAQFLDAFDRVFVLDIDADTLRGRLDERPEDEFGSTPAERDFILALHEAGTNVPAQAIVIDATVPLPVVVDELLRQAEEVAGGAEHR